MQFTVEVNHTITPDSRHLFGAAQICEISPGLLSNVVSSDRRLSPGTPVVCRYANNKQFLCKWFAPPGKNLKTGQCCFVDDTVELLEDPVETEQMKAEDVPELKDLLLIGNDVCFFTKVTVDLHVDCSKLDLKLIGNRNQLADLLRDLIRPLFFRKRCIITLENKEIPNYGITSLHINNVNGTSRYGQVENETVVEINRIHFRGSRSRHIKSLGGLSTPEEAIQKCLRINSTENVLLAGPPGSGKYSLVAQLAREGNHPMFEIRGLDFIKSYPGETELELRKIFGRLGRFKELFGGPSKVILMVKDVDFLCPKISNRRGEDLGNITRISSQFLTLLEQYHTSGSGVIVIGTTSNLENLDSKIRRPGRLGMEVFIRIPSEEQRREIMNAVLNQTGSVFESFAIDEIIRRTPGYVGADLELLVHTIQRSMDRNPDQGVFNTLDESLKKIRPTSLRNSIGLVSGLSQTLDSIGGMEQLKKVLRVSILGPLQHPSAFRRFGMSPLKGILLYGPPGCAKTTIAKCLAAESRMTFVSVSAAEVYSPYVGDAEKLITRLFNQARLSAPAVIFLDEIDSLVGNRGTHGVRSNDVHVRVLSTLLTEMDGIGVSVQSTVASSDDSKNILLIAATNRPDMIDDALLRPGRLTKLIHVPAPDEQARFEILKKVSEKVPLADDVCLRQLAEQTERYSGADLQNLCSQAALHAAALDENVQQIAMDHFQHIFRESSPSLTVKQIEWYAQYESKHT